MFPRKWQYNDSFVLAFIFTETITDLVPSNYYYIISLLDKQKAWSMTNIHFYYSNQDVIIIFQEHTHWQSSRAFAACGRIRNMQVHGVKGNNYQQFTTPKFNIPQEVVSVFLHMQCPEVAPELH